MLLMRDNTEFIPVKNPNLQESRTEAKHLPIAQRLSSFDEVEQTYTKEEAENEAARCLKCPTHWCEKQCPAGVPVTDFIAAFRRGDVEGAYQLIRGASALPEICSRVCPQHKQCQSECTRSIRSMAVGIGRLERYVVDAHYASGAAEKTAASTGKKVAVVGAGPSGLSVAQFLTDKGHAVTVYDKEDRMGGLMEYGIPNMKLEKGIVERKIQSMERQGVTFVYNTLVGRDITEAELESQFDAVVLAIGTGNARKLQIAGLDQAKGVYMAVDFLTSNTKSFLDSKLSDGKNVSAEGKHVIIVGGGDTGNDCVGTSIRTGAASVTQLEMMPKHVGREFIHSPRIPKLKEVKTDTSQEECKVRFGKDPHIYQTTVKEIKTDASGQITAVVTVDLDAIYDEHFRLSLEEIPGTEKELPCDLMIIAAGFSGPDHTVIDHFKVDITERSNIATTDYRTSKENVFACGDCRTGQSLVVKAMVDGRTCADVVDAYLK